MADKKETRKYSRGNQEVDLDLFLDTAEKEFNLWLAGTGFNDKLRKQVKEKFGQLVQGIESGDIKYRRGGGFTNTQNITNDKKGFDAVGYAAGFLGNVLRALDSYTEPEKPSDPSKPKYNDKGSLATLFNNYKGDFFIESDDIDSTTNKRSTTNRRLSFYNFLTDVNNNFKKYYEDSSDEDYNDYKSKYLKFLEYYNSDENALIDSNEWNKISQIFGGGLPLNEWFTTDGVALLQTIELTPELQAAQEEYTKQVADSQYLGWRDEYIQQNPITLSFSRVLTQQDFDNDILQTLNKINNQNLGKSIMDAIENPNGTQISENLNNILKKSLTFKNKDYLYYLTGIANSRGLLKETGISGEYYFPQLSNVYGNNSEMTYSISGDNRKLELKHKASLPVFKDDYSDLFTAWTPSYKLGGNIRKHRIGLTVELIAGNKGHNYYAVDRDNYNNTHGSWLINLLQGFTPENFNISDFSTNGVSLQNSWNTNGGWSYYDAPDWTNSYSYSGLNNFLKAFDTSTYGKLLRDIIGLNKLAFNSNVADKNRNHLDSFNSDGTHSTKYDDDWGGITLSRRLGLHNISSDDIKRQYLDEIKRLGATGYFEYDDHWFPYVDSIDLNSLGISPESVIRFETTPKTQEPTPKTPSSNEEGEDTESELGERQISTGGISSLNISKFKPENLVPDLLETGSLALTLAGNRKKRNELDKLRPWLKNDYNLHYNVTGNWGARQEAAKLAANLMHYAKMALTSDASLNSAIALDAMMKANDTNLKGMLADNERIFQTANKSWEVSADNARRWSDTANFNRKLLYDFNDRRTRLNASYYDKLYNSLANYLATIAGRQRTKYDENEAKYYAMQEREINNRANRWYNNAIAVAEEAKRKWEVEHPGEYFTSDTSGAYKKYSDYYKVINDMLNDYNNYNLMLLYGHQGTRTWNDDEMNTINYDNFSKYTRPILNK